MSLPLIPFDPQHPMSAGAGQYPVGGVEVAPSPIDNEADSALLTEAGDTLITEDGDVLVP